MLSIDAASAVPINDQIKAGLRGLVARGLLRPGDQAPSVRGLAATLKVNPNTVARAFRELALEGFLDTRRGDGAYIAETVGKHVKAGLEEACRTFGESVRQARRGGLDWRDIGAQVAKAKAEER